MRIEDEFEGRDKDSPESHSPADQAESALQLLRSLANAAVSPEALEQAFLDWSRLSDDARTNPEFGYILTNIVAGWSNDDGAPDIKNIKQAGHLPPVNFEDVFFLDQNGIVVDISAELSNLLNTKIGDAISPAVFQVQFEKDQVSHSDDAAGSAETIELRDKFNIKRRIVLHRLEGSSADRKYAAVYIRINLSNEAREELQSRAGLTRSELEILELAIQRYNPEQISSLRSSKLNTVRTHISRLIQKMECRSLNEAVGAAIELALAQNFDADRVQGALTVREHSARKVTITNPDAVVEYIRYGPISGEPVIILHSVEYGYRPNQEFLDAARERNKCLYFVRRPGYGESSSAMTIEDSALVIGRFIQCLDIKDATLVGLSTSAPVALAVQTVRDRIKRLILVNHGLNSTNKVETIEPKWIRGMIKMALTSPSSFSVGLSAVRTFFRAYGKQRFYRLLYSSIEEDLRFVEQNESIFEESGDFILGADRINIRLDIISSFTPNRQLQHHIAGHRSVVVANGEFQHWIPPEHAHEDARRLGLRFDIVPNGGRNWPFVQPNAFFDIVEQRDRAAANR